MPGKFSQLPELGSIVCFINFLIALLTVNNLIDAELAKRVASHTRQQEHQTSHNESLTQPAANLMMAVPNGHFSRPATLVSARTHHNQVFNFLMPGHVQPGYLAMAQPQVPLATINVVPQVGTATGPAQDCL